MSGLSVAADTEEVTALDTVFRIATRIGRRQRVPSTAGRSRFWHGDMEWYWVLVIAPPVLSVGCMIVSWWMASSWFHSIALLLLALSYITGPVVYPLIMVCRYRDTMGRFIRFPASVLIDEAQRDATADRADILKLANQADWALDYALAYIRLKRAALERRAGLLVGALDKIGLISGLVTLAAALHSFGLFDAAAAGPPWLDGMLYGVFGLYVVGFIAHLSMMRMDRMTGALGLAIEAAAGQTDRPPSSPTAGQRHADLAGATQA